MAHDQFINQVRKMDQRKIDSLENKVKELQEELNDAHIMLSVKDKEINELNRSLLFKDIKENL